MTKHPPAPAPWDFEASGKPGSNSDLNIYVVDVNRRKIAAVWGKRDEKEATACMMIAAPDLYMALKRILQDSDRLTESEFQQAAAAIANAEGVS